MAPLLFGGVAGFVLGLFGLFSLAGLGLSPGVTAFLGLLAIFVVTAVAYALAAVALLPVMLATPSSASGPTPLPNDPTELFVRGFIIGLGASVNFALWTIFSGSQAVGVAFAFVTLVATVPGVSAVPGYQTVLGWASWLLPMSHIFFVTPVGLLFFLLALVSGGAAFRFDVFTCTIETAGGGFVSFLFSIASFAGFNLGNFTFLAPGVTPTPTFLQPGISAHETGHTLSLAAFGGVYHWIGMIDQSVPPLDRSTSAYSELTAESHFPIGRHVRVWS